MAIAGARAFELSSPGLKRAVNRKRLVSGESMNKADLVDRNRRSLQTSQKAQATTAIDNHRGQCYRCPSKKGTE